MSSSKGPFVFDASAILALIFEEPGAENVRAQLFAGVLGAINLTEVVTRLMDRGVPFGRATDAVDELGLRVVAFDRHLALRAASLRPLTRAVGLSVGDRACIALASHLGYPAVTADRTWATVADAAGVTVVLIR